MEKTPKPHPLNAPGDFYVEFECCLTCGVPIDIAPELFAWENARVTDEGQPVADSCYIRKQPTTPGELKKMMEVMAAQELECIRYRGSDPAIMRRIREEGGYDFFDRELPSP